MMFGMDNQWDFLAYVFYMNLIKKESKKRYGKN